MSKSIKQLRQELATLYTIVSNLARELVESYGKYFQNLGDSVARQLVLAAYQICTQKYPQQFLKLSYNNRHDFQQKIKGLKSIFKKKLADYLLDIDGINQEIIETFRQIICADKSEIPQQELNLNEENEENVNEDYSQKTEADSQSIIKENEEQITPDSLIRFHLQIDKSIDEALKDISQAANRYLQKDSILPRQLPAKILDMALQAEESASVMSSSPNLLSLLIEREQNQETEARDITPITAICMRLSEIEFADPSLAVHRQQIRNILTQIQNLKEQYQKKQQQYAIAEAETAWRSSWFDE
jgi:hypothetical protein